MAFPTWQAAGVAVESTTVDVSPAWPVHQANDIGILIVQSPHGLARLVTAQGFQEFPVSPQRLNLGSAFENGLLVYWKRATSGAEAAPTVKFNSDHVRARIVTFRGCSTTGRPFTTAAGKTATSSTAAVFSALTTTDPDSLIVDIIRHSIDGSSPGLSGWTNTSLAALTEQIDDGTIAGLGGGFAVHTGQKAVAGAVNATTATLGVTATQAMISFALTAVAQPVDKMPYLKAYGTVAESATVAINPAWPPHVIGDVALLLVESGGWPVVLSIPAGFVEVANSPQNGGVSGTSGGTQLSVYWCRATGAAMGAPTVGFTVNHIRATIVTFGNCINAGNPVDVSSGSSTSGVAATMSYTVPGATSTGLNDLIVAIGTTSRNVSSRNEFSSWANPSLNYVTERYDDVNNIGDGTGFGFATGEKATIGVFDATTGLLLNSTHQGRVMVALKGASGADFVTDRGDFVLTGFAATFIHDRTLIADPGVFALAGMVVDWPIVQTYIIDGEVGEFSSVGFGVFLTKASRGWRKAQEKKTSIWTKKPELDLEN